MKEGRREEADQSDGCLGRENSSRPLLAGRCRPLRNGDNFEMEVCANFNEKAIPANAGGKLRTLCDIAEDEIR